MGSRRLSDTYFCGNCEDECKGVPAGFRRGREGRPLCSRCVGTGAVEGWAAWGGEPSFLKKAFVLSVATIALAFLLIFLLFLDLGRQK